MSGAADIPSQIIQVLRRSGECTVGELCRHIDGQRMSAAPDTMAEIYRMSWMSKVCDHLDDLVGLGLVEVCGEGTESAVFRVTDKGKRIVVGAGQSIDPTSTQTEGADSSTAFA